MVRGGGWKEESVINGFGFMVDGQARAETRLDFGLGVHGYR
jgi:hypothetical protein